MANQRQQNTGRDSGKPGQQPGGAGNPGKNLNAEDRRRGGEASASEQGRDAEGQFTGTDVGDQQPEDRAGRNDRTPGQGGDQSIHPTTPGAP
jgi:hypothetical protein